jgi:hypothetical protein
MVLSYQVCDGVSTVVVRVQELGRRIIRVEGSEKDDWKGSRTRRKNGNGSGSELIRWGPALLCS